MNGQAEWLQDKVFARAASEASVRGGNGGVTKIKHDRHRARAGQPRGVVNRDGPGRRDRAGNSGQHTHRGNPDYAPPSFRGVVSIRLVAGSK